MKVCALSHCDLLCKPCSLIALGGHHFSEWKQTRSGSGEGEVLQWGVGTGRGGGKRYCSQDILYEKIIYKINVYEVHKG